MIMLSKTLASLKSKFLENLSYYRLNAHLLKCEV